MRKALLAVALLCLPIIAAAQATSLAPYFKMQLLDNSGAPCAGCTLSSFSAGTSTPLATYTDSSGLSQNTNPIVLDSAGRANIWLGTNSYKFVLKDANGVTLWTVDNVNNYFLLSRNNTWTGTETFNGNVTFNGSATFNGSVTFGSGFVTINGVCVPTAYTSVGIQAAINACPNGGQVYLPAGLYVITGTMTITKSLIIRGAGWPGTSAGTSGGTILQVASGVSGTTPIFQVTPATNTVLDGGKFQDFAITTQSGTPGQYGIFFDGSNGEIAHWLIDHVLIGGDNNGLGSYAVFASGNGNNTVGSPQGTPVLTTIQNSYLRGCIKYTNSGDTNRIINNQITGACGNDFSFISGATGLVIQHNNITSDGGTHFGTKVFWPQILGNEFETFGTFTGSNGAIIDFDGAATVGDTIEFGIIRDNGFSTVNGIVTNAIRLNYETNAIVEGNRFNRGAAGSHDILATANSAQTAVGNNNFASGLPWSDMFNDSGSGNTLLTNFSSGQLVMKNNRALAGIDDAGTGRAMVMMQTSGSVMHYGYRGQKAFEGVSGSSYIYDGSGSNNIAAAFGSTLSAVPVTSTWSSFANAAANTYSTTTNCNSAAAPAVCGSAAAGSVVIAAASTNVVVNTTAVTANSQILLTQDDSLGTRLGVTCNTNWFHVAITGRTAGTGFTIVADSAPVTNPLCLSYLIIN